MLDVFTPVQNSSVHVRIAIEHNAEGFAHTLDDFALAYTL